MGSFGMDPEILGCIRDTQEILAFELPEGERESVPMLSTIFITNPEPVFITGAAALAP